MLILGMASGIGSLHINSRNTINVVFSDTQNTIGFTVMESKFCWEHQLQVDVPLAAHGKSRDMNCSTAGFIWKLSWKSHEICVIPRTSSHVLWKSPYIPIFYGKSMGNLWIFTVSHNFFQKKGHLVRSGPWRRLAAVMRRWHRWLCPVNLWENLWNNVGKTWKKTDLPWKKRTRCSPRTRMQSRRTVL